MGVWVYKKNLKSDNFFFKNLVFPALGAMPTVLGWPQLINKAINREILQLEIPDNYSTLVRSVDNLPFHGTSNLKEIYTHRRHHRTLPPILILHAKISQTRTGLLAEAIALWSSEPNFCVHTQAGSTGHNIQGGPKKTGRTLLKMVQFFWPTLYSASQWPIQARRNDERSARIVITNLPRVINMYHYLCEIIRHDMT